MIRFGMALVVCAHLFLTAADPVKPPPSDAATKLLISSITRKDIAGVQIALRQGADPNVGGADKTRPIGYALFVMNSLDSPADRQQKFAILKTLFAAGAKLTSIDGELQAAISSNDKQIFSFLLEKGLNPHERIDGYSSLEYAYLHECDSLIPLLKARNVPDIDPAKKPLMKVLRAITNYDYKGLKTSIKALENINQLDSGGRTALVTALNFPMWSTSKELVVELVFSAIPDFNIPSGHPADYGNYPLHLLVNAYTRDSDEAKLVANFLRFAVNFGKATPAVLNNHKETPLHIAAKHNNTEVIKILLEAGADPLVRDVGGHRASYKAKDTAVRQLLQEAETKATAK